MAALAFEVKFCAFRDMVEIDGKPDIRDPNEAVCIAAKVKVAVGLPNRPKPWLI
ncbi:hypothetical protein [Rhizobium laguerreae]|uniref:hypothetical protein n=1 Tax=Rhizobium laguerreae TaxID=1076926 RepID=UPI001C908FB1|nr:hypothetical protein [Rhizobium laguerreae]MBY3222195.1 hypothetical protein [Rhizobium laguerreae]